MSLTVHGQTGVVLVGPHVAVELGPWTWNGQDVITAEVRRVDAFWRTQPATAIRLDLGRVAWRWRLAGADAGAGIYRVSGLPEER